VRSPDPWLQVHDRWLVRQLAPDAVKIELPSSQEDSRLVFAPALIRAMGFESTNIHLGNKSPSDLQTAMDRLRRDLGGDWLITATGRMAKVTRQDHMEWKNIGTLTRVQEKMGLTALKSAKRGTSSTRAEIYSKPPPKRLLGVIFHLKTARIGIWTRLLREILAHNIDCMQVSASTRLYFTQ
jgi:hypothetical protein